MIQILIAILASISVVSGTAFVAYEAGQESTENTTQPGAVVATETESELVLDSATSEDETAADAEAMEGEPNEPIEPEDTATPSAELNTTATSTSTDPTVSQEQGIRYAQEESDTAHIETGTSTPTSTNVDIAATPPITPPATFPAQNLKESALASISSLLDIYNTTINWIDNGIMPLLSQRERILDGLILNTQELMANNSNPLALYVYDLFIGAYTLDKRKIGGFYRDKLSAIKDRMNSENISSLKAEYEKFSAASSVSKAEYDALAQLLLQYEGSLQSTYNVAIQSTMIEYISQIGSTDGMYQKLWAQLSIIVSDPDNTAQNVENIVNQLRLGQPTPLD